MPIVTLNGALDSLANREEQLSRLITLKSISKHEKGAGLSLHAPYTVKRQRLINETKTNLGDDALRTLSRIIPIFTTNSTHQRAFFEIFLQANIKGVFGEAFDANEIRIKKAFGINDIFPLASLRCPRRFGKTQITAQFVAAMMFVYQDFQCAVFSPAKRQSSDFMGLVRKNVEKISRETGLQYSTADGQDNKEVFCIVINGNNRKFTALPSSTSHVRGTTANLVICEECAAMDPKFFKLAVLPLLSVEKTALICISTTQGTENFYDQLLSFTNVDGSASAFNSYTFTLSCEACMAAGKSEKCKHKQHELPPWMSGERTDFVQHIYAQFDDSKIMMQEVMGISNTKNENAFEIARIEALFDPIRTPCSTIEVIPGGKLRDIYMFIDPNGGGDSSHLAIATFFRLEGTIHMLGLESLPTKEVISDQSDATFITKHVTYIRSMDEFAHSRIICFIENNTGPHTLDNLARYFPNDDSNFIRVNLDSLKQHNVQLLNQPRSGVHTGPEIKQAGYAFMRDALTFKAIKFYNRFFSLYSPKGPDYSEKNASAAKRLLFDQWKRYSIIKILPKDADTGVIKYTFGGKGGSNMQDDVITAFLCGLAWQRLWLECGLLSDK
jgi:Terminase large subunit, T4likevirus-type, N-terminal